MLLIILSLGSIAFELGSIIFLKALMTSVSGTDAPRISVVGLMAGIGGCWLGRAVANQNLLNESSLLAPKIKNALILMIFEKVSARTHSPADSEVGRMINMLSNDFNVLERKLTPVILAMSFPLRLLAISIVLCSMFGWLTLLLFPILALAFFMQYLLGKLLKKFKVEINAFRDRRIEHIAEVMEGLSVIKLSGWETLFHEEISRVRSEEVRSYLKLKAVKSVGRIFEEVASLTAAFVWFVVIFFASGELLSSAIMLTALQSIVYLNQSFANSRSAINSAFTFGVVFDRFAIIVETSTELGENEEMLGHTEI